MGSMLYGVLLAFYQGLWQAFVALVAITVTTEKETAMVSRSNMQAPILSKGNQVQIPEPSYFLKRGGNTYQTSRRLWHPQEEFSFLLNSHTCVLNPQGELESELTANIISCLLLKEKFVFLSIAGRRLSSLLLLGSILFCQSCHYCFTTVVLVVYSA